MKTLSLETSIKELLWVGMPAKVASAAAAGIRSFTPFPAERPLSTMVGLGAAAAVL